jgi:hypothetical protein
MTTSVTVINDLVDFQGGFCVLNEKIPGSARAIFSSGGQLESDADAQLLINIPFTQPVRLAYLSIEGVTASQTPRRVRLYANRGSIGFSDVDECVTQAFDLQDCKGGPVKLNMAKFSNLRNLTVFVEDNAGDAPSTAISKLTLSGNPLQGTDMSKLKKVG